MGDTTTKQGEAEGTLHMEHKCVGVTGFKAYEGDGDEGLVEALVSVTGLRDNVKDVIKPGAYEKSLLARTPKGVWHHSWSDSVSRTEGIKELLPGDPELPETLPNGQPWPKDAGALKVKTRFNLKTQRGREAYEDVIFFGDQQEWSIGYNVPVGGATVDSKSGVRTIHTLDLYEYSPVLFGAMPSARTSSVKEAQIAYKSLQGEDLTEWKDAAGVAPDEELGQEETQEEEIDADEASLFDGVEDDEDFTDDEYDFGDESKAWGFMDGEGYFTKASPRQIGVSPAQAQKVYRALASLSELLRDMRVDLEEDGVSQEGIASTEEGDDGGEQTDFSDTSLSDLVSKSLDNEDAASAAADFDTAFEDDDRDGMEEAADTLIDAIEAAIEDGEDKATFSEIGGYIAWAVDQVGDPDDEEEDADSEDDSNDDEDSTDKEEKSFTGASNETFTLNVDEIKSLLE